MDASNSKFTYTRPFTLNDICSFTEQQLHSDSSLSARTHGATLHPPWLPRSCPKLLRRRPRPHALRCKTNTGPPASQAAAATTRTTYRHTHNVDLAPSPRLSCDTSTSLPTARPRQAALNVSGAHAWSAVHGPLAILPELTDDAHEAPRLLQAVHVGVQQLHESVAGQQAVTAGLVLRPDPLDPQL